MENNKDLNEFKNIIIKLYEEEGRSIRYISNLLDVGRSNLSKQIQEWGLIESQKKHLKPSTVKFINMNRALIKSRLDSDVTIADLAKELKVKANYLSTTIIRNDMVLEKANEDRLKRSPNRKQARIEELKEKSSLTYDFEDLNNEEWREVLGYPNYFVSNFGRFKKYIKSSEGFILMKTTYNKTVEYNYIGMINETGKRKNLRACRVVGFAFVDGFSEEKNTINHIDGNTTNDSSDNLEWISQRDNNLHSYRVLNKAVNKNKKRYEKIVYKEKYEFKTVRGLAKFLGVSESQAHRLLKKSPDIYYTLKDKK